MTKQQTSNHVAVAICATIFCLLTLYAIYSTSSIAPTIPAAQSSMSEAERLKQKIREKEIERDAYLDAANAAAGARDFEKSSENARKAAEIDGVIKELWEKVHDANMREGESDDGGNGSNGTKSP